MCKNIKHIDGFSFVDYNCIKLIYVYMQNSHINNRLCNIGVTMRNIGAILV